MEPRPSVFLDRDGTIIVDRNYIAAAKDVSLIDGAAEAIARLNRASFPVIVVSNQSGIGRGYFSLKDFDLVQSRVQELLAAGGAHLDGAYICPHVPERQCECRKPGTLLYRKAIAEHDLDASSSWYVGDRWRDVAPAEILGGSGILIPGPETSEDERELAAARAYVAPSISAAVDHILGPRV